MTMDWWNELWLNEGFATWVGWLAVDHFHPGKFDCSDLLELETDFNPTEWKVWSQFVVRSARGTMRLVNDDIDEYAG